MPELPEVEAVCRRLRENLALEATGSIPPSRIVEARILRPSVTRPQLPAEVERTVAGRALHAIRRIGKHILLDLDPAGPTLFIHLRMTGNLYLVPDVRFHVATARAWLQLSDGRAIVFDDPRALGRMSIQPRDLRPPSTGPEPNQIAASEFVRIAKQSRTPVKLLLMDQSKIAGLGNIYAAEALFQARIHPAKPAASISARKLISLHAAIVDMLEVAKESAYRAYSEPGYFAEGESFPVAVYGREGEPCPACSRPVRRIPQGGRSTYFCPKCQR